MKPPVETVRTSRQGRDQLIKLKKYTGAAHWNELCRWALCASLAEPNVPPLHTQKLEGGVEMSWRVFAGDQQDLFRSLIILRASKDGFPSDSEGIGECFRAHLHRGLNFLSSGLDTRSVASFFARWVGD
ncbi:DNA sulfur modification protein DndE [Thioflavicoccus mobilis 8321]|uniref:DNA sulfur modification protein DndE n=1 Tax=Thioflavicoccus mobilis 8321 TaxID=765912 RepID=L0H1B2_9GAMM|nr:DNA sulfur modification protein DndE [Thioflavicoccus mobilis]AGA91425.1 DNA sulfur modification protein DndE [Thioflavicoccus mobilis 8321]